jgi:hypothetical protein
MLKGRRSSAAALGCRGVDHYKKERSTMRNVNSKMVGCAVLVCMLAIVVMPSMASAVSWDPPNTRHTLTSTNLAFNVAAVGAGWLCSQSTFEGDVGSAQIVITSAVFTGCIGTGGADRCTNVTWTATGLPWTATPSTTNVQIHGVNVDIVYNGPAACQFTGQRINLTGTLSSGVFSNAAHDLNFAGGTGLIGHNAALGSNPVTVTGTITDDQRTLVITD